MIDVLIIGSGIAGSLLAQKLAEQGLSVTVLEAGKAWQRAQALQRYQNSWNRNLTAPYEQPSWTWTSADKGYFGEQGTKAYQPSFLKGVGGTTWHWTGITPRFLPSDFSLHETYGVGRDWPLSYAELEPYYTAAEYAIGVSGDSQNPHGSPRSKPYPMSAIPMSYGDQVLAKYLAKQGLQVAALPAARNSRSYDDRPACRGNNMCTPLCPIAASYSAEHSMRKAEQAGVQLLTAAVAYRLEVNAQEHIEAVHYKTPDGQSKRLQARHVVLACHTLETARLLLMSATESHAKGVANSSGQVGRNLMDHAIFVSHFRMPEALYLGRGPQSISTILHGRDGMFRSEYAAAKFFLGNDINIHQKASQLMQEKQYWPHFLEHLRDVSVHHGQLGAELETLPSADNMLTLDHDRLDPLGLPLPNIQYQLSDYTHKGLREWQAFVQAVLSHMGAEYQGTHTSLSSHHPAGTTRMGSYVSDSVVNANCQSHDHANLYMVGGSVFPSMGTANPSLTIAALSLRLADHLLSRMQA